MNIDTFDTNKMNTLTNIKRSKNGIRVTQNVFINHINIIKTQPGHVSSLVASKCPPRSAVRSDSVSTN